MRALPLTTPDHVFDQDEMTQQEDETTSRKQVDTSLENLLSSHQFNGSVKRFEYGKDTPNVSSLVTRVTGCAI
jgi:hypothetical protein